jgi:hypothetical protein
MYSIYLTDSSPEFKVLQVSRKVDEDDLARTIGQRVTIIPMSTRTVMRQTTNSKGGS